MKNKNDFSLSNTFGGFLGKYEYEAEQIKRRRSSGNFALRVTFAVLISAAVVSISFFSFVSSAFNRSSKSFDEKPPELNTTEETEPSIKVRVGTDNPESLICLSRLGLSGEEIDKKDSDRYNIPQGVKIMYISKRASDAGLQINDIIVCLNNKFVHSVKEMSSILSDIHDTNEIEISFYRNGKYKWLKFPLY